MGSTDRLTDSAEVVSDNYVYQAFGEIKSSSGVTENLYTWVGELSYRAEPEFGGSDSRYLLDRRSFGASSGRFLSEDPIGFEAGDENLYRYVGNDGVGEVDPSGLRPLFLDGDTERDVDSDDLGTYNDLLLDMDAILDPSNPAHPDHNDPAHWGSEWEESQTRNTVTDRVTTRRRLRTGIPLSREAKRYLWAAAVDEEQRARLRREKRESMLSAEVPLDLVSTIRWQAMEDVVEKGKAKRFHARRYGGVPLNAVEDVSEEDAYHTSWGLSALRGRLVTIVPVAYQTKDGQEKVAGAAMNVLHSGV